MSYILNIDTSLETATVSIAKEGKILAFESNHAQKEHASFLHIAIEKILNTASITQSDIEAIACTEGPGSYTGLRVGMASAKGLAYALNIPFITIGTLEAMAHNAIENFPSDNYFVPMIDARRMEVFTSVYNSKMEIQLPASAMILDKQSYADFLTHNTLSFFGSGVDKWKAICEHENAQYLINKNLHTSVAILTYLKFKSSNFADLVLSEPLYIKEFYTGN